MFLMFHIVCISLSYLSSVHSEEGLLKLSDILPESRLYDKMRPPTKNGEPTRVYFHVTVMGIDSINENSMTYAADIFFAQSWYDDRLRLPENMTSEYRLLEVEWLDEMWRPDSYFKNAKQVTFQTMTIPNHYVWLYDSKKILYMVKLTLTLSCAMNYAIYPHDTQECKLQMESLSHTTKDLIFEWDLDVPLVVDEHIELPQFDLVRNTTDDCTQVYSTGNFTCLEVVFKLKRRLGYYLFHTYMPTCLIVIMSWISFWIKPEAAPARVTLGVTSLLTLSTQHAKSQASLPPVSYIKIIDMFMNTCTIFVFLALMEYALVNIVLGDGPDTPQTVKKPTSHFCVSCVGKKTSPEMGSSEEKESSMYTLSQRSNTECSYGKLVFMAKQLRSPKSSDIPTVSNESNSMLTDVKPINRKEKRVTPPVMYKCGHQVPHKYFSQLNHEKRFQSSSFSYPELSMDGRGESSGTLPKEGHTHPHCRSVSVGPNIKHPDNHMNSPEPKTFWETTKQSTRCRSNLPKKVSDNVANSIDSDLRNMLRPGGQPLGQVPPPPPPPQTQQQKASLLALSMAQKRRAKAIVVDRFSRVFFPLTFGLINCVYWIAFWSYL